MSSSVFYDNPEPHEPVDPFDEPAAGAPRHHVPEVHELVNEAIEMIETARPAPLSTAIKLDGAPLLEILNEILDRLPDELREARWLLREREEYLASVRREGDEITNIARSHAERMVERTEVAKSAEQRAQRIIANAETQARLMRHETEDFCDARLASLEGILDRTRTVVTTGRTRMQGNASIDLTEHAEPLMIEEDRAPIFDQDFS